MTHTGFATTNIRYSASNAYDVDPTVGSTAMPGYTELSTLYRRYRVFSTTLVATFANLEVFPGTVCVCPVNADPGANVSVPQPYMSFPGAKTSMVGAVSGDSVRVIRSTASPQTFGGSRYTGADDSYSALVNAGPTNQIWWYIGFFTPTNSLTTTGGVDVNVRLFVTLDFYELATPPT